MKTNTSKPKPLSIYIHIPFCERKCAYCDFVSFDNKTDSIDAYVDVLCNEVDAFYRENANTEPANTVFVGGGTPSLLSTVQLTEIFSRLKIKPNAEITIECNPNSIIREKLLHYQTLGINRLSIGVQSFNDETLKTLGRIHTSKQAIEAIELAHLIGFKNINIDLIHSVPLQRSTPVLIPQAVFGLVTHVSAYSLIIEPNTPFAKKHKPVDDNTSIIEQKQIEKLLKTNDFAKYEVSNFAKPGYQCRHNNAYWQPHIHEYIGFGLGAHGLVNNQRYSNTKNLSEYLNKKNKKQKSNQRNNKDLIDEIIMLGLRTTRGIKFNDLQTLGYDLLTKKHNEIQMLINNKLIKIGKDNLVVTDKGFFVLNQIINKLTPDN